VALGLLAACSSNGVAPQPDGAGDAPDDSAIESRPETGTPDGLAGADGGHCGRTNLGATITVYEPDGSMLSCTAPTDAGVAAAPPRTWVGKVTGSDASSLIVSVCAPGAGNDDAGATDAGGIDAGVADGGCVPSALRIEAFAPGLDLTRFPQAWVRVRATVSRFFACQQSLEITTADPTDGTTPSGPAGQLLLAVVDGGGTFAGSPYEVAHTQLGCAPARTCNGSATAADDYAFDFSGPSGAGSPLRVYMGETATWTLGGASFTARNLRSFQTMACDDYWNWAYTLYVDPK
jgi:hypothetical protein